MWVVNEFSHVFFWSKDTVFKGVETFAMTSRIAKPLWTWPSAFQQNLSRICWHYQQPMLQTALQNQQEIFTFSQAITYPLTTRQLNQTTPRIDENCHWSVGVIGLACKPWMAWFPPRQLSTVGRGEPLHLKSLEFLD